ncbi:class I SAM-dependent methyltransferase [Rhodococcus sp. P1Y]|nr:class I SAM-dependent methyltransferase [Rhodococcus sp. P1Y]
MDKSFWDGMYSARERNWSGNPNPVLMQQASGLTVGRALDVGCGEGDDARWLAAQGWTVTAADISTVALDRARRLTAADAAITWLQADLSAAPPPAESFDLVSVHYFALPKANGSTAALGIAQSVASGGTLLIVGHAIREGNSWNGISPTDFLEPHDVGLLLGDGWSIELDETRSRTTPAPEGSGHTHDTVLRARRH